MRFDKRFLQFGAVLAIAVAAVWTWLFLSSRDDSGDSRSGGLVIEARCGVAAGGALASDALSITCGLDDTGIEAVVAQSIRGFDLPTLIDQIRRDRIEDPDTLDALALRLGLTSEAVIALLRGLGERSADPVTPEAFAAALLGGDEAAIAVRVVGPADRGTGETNRPDRREISRVLQESDRLQIECGAVAREKVAVGTADIRCGPDQEDIDAIVQRLVAESDLAGLVEELRQGTLGRAALIDALGTELHLSRRSVLSLLGRLAAAGAPADRLTEDLATLARRHAVLTHRIGGLPASEPGAQRVRERAAAAVAKGDYETAGMLLDLWARADRVEHALGEATQTLDAIRGRLERSTDQRKALQRQLAALWPAGESGPEASSERSAGNELDGGDLFVSPEGVALRVPPTVVAGSVLRFPWRGPKAPGDLLFIAEPDMGENRYPLSDEQHHRSDQGSPAQLVAPAAPGRYEVRYFSFGNGAVLARKPLAVTAAQVVMNLPDAVNAGAVLRFPWHGPDAPGDLIFIAPPDMAGNRYPISDRHRHRTALGSPAQLVAPAAPGRYEVRYFSFSNGAVLKTRPLTVR